MEKQTQRIDICVERGGEGGKHHITICKIESQWEFAVGLRKIKKGLCISLDGWDGEGDGRKVPKGVGIYVYLWLIHVEV